MYRIDDDLKEFIESGVATIVGTGDADGRPHMTMGWGPRVTADGSVDVFLDKERAAQTLADLEWNGRIAVTVVHPVTVRSVQLKGRYCESGEPDATDREWVERHREAFSVSTALVGDPPGVIKNLWLEETVRVVFEVDGAFDQTPGPEAGKPL
jgi:hypothetical protein